MSIVRALPSEESGNAILELRNDFAQPVTVVAILAGVADVPAQWMGSLLDTPLRLQAGERLPLDVSKQLLSFLQSSNLTAGQAHEIKIALHAMPEPPGQPGPGRYVVSYSGGKFTTFSSAAG